MKMNAFLMSAAIVLFFVACGGQESQNIQAGFPQDVEYRKFDPIGKNCTYCQDEIRNKRFGGEIETAGGEKLLFGSLECLGAYVLENPDIKQNGSKIWVADYNAGTKVVPYDQARYFRTELLNSPNNLQLFAFTGKEQLDDNFRVAYGGDTLSWNRVLEYVNKQWNISMQE